MKSVRSIIEYEIDCELRPFHARKCHFSKVGNSESQLKYNSHTGKNAKLIKK